MTDKEKTKLVKEMLKYRYEGSWSKRNKGCMFWEFTLRHGANVATRIDALYIEFSAKHGKILAFEIKASRGDFLKDKKNFQEKHGDILKICNQFFYVCLPDLIKPEELPSQAGLIYVDKKSISTRIKKQAPLNKLKQLPWWLLKSVAYSFTQVEIKKDFELLEDEIQRLKRERKYLIENHEYEKERLIKDYEWRLKLT